MVWVRFPVYYYKRNNTYYFCRGIPSDLRHRFNKNKIEVSLKTRSKIKAKHLASALSDKLDRHWDNLRMELIYSQELGLTVNPHKKVKNNNELSILDSLAIYQKLKGVGKNKLFFQGSARCVRYLIECIGHTNLSELAPSDAGRFRDYLFDRGLTSSSVKRVFINGLSSVGA